MISNNVRSGYITSGLIGDISNISQQGYPDINNFDQNLRSIRAVENSHNIFKVFENSRHFDHHQKITGRRTSKFKLDFSIYGSASMRKCRHYLETNDAAGGLYKIAELINKCGNDLSTGERCDTVELKLPREGRGNEIVCYPASKKAEDSSYKFDVSFSEINDTVTFFRLTDRSGNDTPLSLEIDKNGVIDIVSIAFERNHEGYVNHFAPHREKIAVLTPRDGTYSFLITSIRTNDGDYIEVNINGRNVYLSDLPFGSKKERKDISHYGMYKPGRVVNNNTIKFQGIRQQHFITHSKTQCLPVSDRLMETEGNGYASQLLYNCKRN